MGTTRTRGCRKTTTAMSDTDREALLLRRKQMGLTDLLYRTKGPYRYALLQTVEDCDAKSVGVDYIQVSRDYRTNGWECYRASTGESKSFETAWEMAGYLLAESEAADEKGLSFSFS